MTLLLTEAQRKQYDEQGFVVLERYFTDSELSSVRARLDAFDEERHNAMHHQQEGISIPDEIVFTHGIANRDATVEAFIRHPKFVALTADILGPNIQLYWDQTVYKRPEGKREFPWHQDNGYAPTDPVHYLTCWVAMNDATLENGCIWVLPKSHQQGVVPHQRTDIGLQCYFGEDPGIPVPIPAGSVVAFQSTLFHRSGSNQSSGMRKAYVVQYSVEGMSNPTTGAVYQNGPVIARDGKPWVG